MSNIIGHTVYTDTPSGYEHLEIEHNGKISYNEMVSMQREVWGDHTPAFEIYPPMSQMVNGYSEEFHYRHLWKIPRNADDHLTEMFPTGNGIPNHVTIDYGVDSNWISCQELKNEFLGEECLGFEIYPANVTVSKIKHIRRIWQAHPKWVWPNIVTD